MTVSSISGFYHFARILCLVWLTKVVFREFSFYISFLRPGHPRGRKFHHSRGILLLPHRASPVPLLSHRCLLSVYCLGVLAQFGHQLRSLHWLEETSGFLDGTALIIYRFYLSYDFLAVLLVLIISSNGRNFLFP